jgi:serine/threonine protein kinase
MAPELITKQTYQGHCVDLFALGIILFILYSGHPPFNQAHPNDPHYKLLATNRADLFWHQHSNSGGKPKGFFSEEFKDLITNMLQLRPEARPSLADCVGHAWMQGPIASAESVRSEFNNRAKTIKAEQAAEAAKKASARQTHTTNKGVRRGESINGKTFISEGVEVAQQEESKDNVVMIQLEKYQSVQQTNTELYSTYEPEFIFSQIISKLQDKDIQPSLKEHKCKMTYEVYKDVKEEENYEELPQQGVRVAVSILKLDDSRVCIEFRRLEGASWFFYEHFQTMKAALSGINDAVAAE